MADDEKPAEEGGGGGGPSKPKEIEGFQVTRAAPQEESPPIMAAVIVIVLLVVGGGIAWKVTSGGDGDGQTAGETTGQADGETTGETDHPPDVPVPDEMWNHIEFLENEGQIEQALDYCIEQEKKTPNSELRARIKELRKELGIGEPGETFDGALDRARTAVSARNWNEAINAAGVAIDLAGEEDNPGEAHFIRGLATGRNGDGIDAIADLEAAVEYGHKPDECEALIKEFGE